MDRTRAVRLVIASVAVSVIATAIARAVTRRGRPPGSLPAEPPAEAAPAWLRELVTRRFNPMVTRLGLVGGRRSPWSFLEHTGRRSGITYRTPVLPMVVDDHAYVPLPYGVDVHWVRNVRAAGHCRLQRHGVVLDLDEPAVVTASDHPGLPSWSRGYLARSGRRYLRLHVLEAAPGTLDSTRDPEPLLAPA